MHLIRPFPGLRPVPARAADVAAPPYDVLSTAEARDRATGHPWSFLHIGKPEIDLPPETNPYATQVYATAAENLKKMLDAGILLRDSKPCYYVYRLEMEGHVQTGLVATASVADYETNRIRKHEFTRPEKEDDRVRQIEALNAQTGPVLLAYPSAPEVDAMLEQASLGTPDADVTLSDGVRHTLWVIADDTVQERLTAAFDAMPALYIADGHHRSAAAARVASTRRAADPAPRGTKSYDYFLSVIFPHHRMKIMDYNRLVKDLNGLSYDEFLMRVTTDFILETTVGQVKPTRQCEFGMYLRERWHRLSIYLDMLPQQDPVGRLDVSLLQNNLIAPILGITDPRRDKRIDFVGGIRGLEELERRVDSHDMAVAFALFPTGMKDLMAVADAGEVMPPKSTWFEPKLADGLVSHILD